MSRMRRWSSRMFLPLWGAAIALVVVPSVSLTEDRGASRREMMSDRGEVTRTDERAVPNPLRHVPDEVLLRVKPGLSAAAAHRVLGVVTTASTRRLRLVNGLYHVKLARAVSARRAAGVRAPQGRPLRRAQLRRRGVRGAQRPQLREPLGAREHRSDRRHTRCGHRRSSGLGHHHGQPLGGGGGLRYRSRLRAPGSRRQRLHERARLRRGRRRRRRQRPCGRLSRHRHRERRLASHGRPRP